MNLDDIPENLSTKDLLKYVILETRQQKQELQKSVDKLTTTILESEEKIIKLEEENRQLKEKIRGIERKDKKNNIIIFGVPQEANEIIANAAINIFKEINVEINLQDINNAYRIGKSEIKPIIVEFNTYLKKQEVTKNAYKLKDTNIAITNELIPEDRETNRILHKYLREARGKKLEARIRNNKLYVGNEVYTVDQLKEQNEELNNITDATFTPERRITQKNSSAPDTANTFDNTNREEGNRSQTTKTEKKDVRNLNNTKSNSRTRNSASKYSLRNSRN